MDNQPSVKQIRFVLSEVQRSGLPMMEASCRQALGGDAEGLRDVREFLEDLLVLPGGDDPW